MNTFKDIAYQILKEAGKPLHSKEITKIALERGWLKTAGKTPEATMNAQLVVDINSKKDKSRFIKTTPSTFGLNPEYKIVAETKIEKIEKIYKVSNMFPPSRKATSPKHGLPNLSRFMATPHFLATSRFPTTKEST